MACPSASKNHTLEGTLDELASDVTSGSGTKVYLSRLFPLLMAANKARRHSGIFWLSAIRIRPPSARVSRHLSPRRHARAFVYPTSAAIKTSCDGKECNVGQTSFWKLRRHIVK